jgi:hypothetical protein
LPGLEDEIATLHDTTLSEGLKQRKLMIVQFWKRDGFGIAVEPFVLLVLSHVQTLRVTVDNPNRVVLDALIWKAGTQETNFLHVFGYTSTSFLYAGSQLRIRSG